jgi:hypothetical protein
MSVKRTVLVTGALAIRVALLRTPCCPEATAFGRSLAIPSRPQPYTSPGKAQNLPLGTSPIPHL